MVGVPSEPYIMDSSVAKVPNTGTCILKDIGDIFLPKLDRLLSSFVELCTLVKLTKQPLYIKKSSLDQHNPALQNLSDKSKSYPRDVDCIPMKTASLQLKETAALPTGAPSPYLYVSELTMDPLFKSTMSPVPQSPPRIRLLMQASEMSLKSSSAFTLTPDMALNIIIEESAIQSFFIRRERPYTGLSGSLISDLLNYMHCIIYEVWHGQCVDVGFDSWFDLPKNGIG
ncbi:uncharacterized protein LOC128643984 [Bombina bombina]|uniref:uncharacterized protein LOC128643984 n=1 Tax=Bombina bombina TaxID=8345 RepID=UPI00235A9D60|nr:uncharacterized protein LOC128643984 [Bombina bombina]